MTQTKPHRVRHESGDFARTRAAAAQAETARRARAARTVADNSLDERDRSALLSMLDLPDPSPEAAGVPVDDLYLLAQALEDYVRAVSDAIGVPHEGTTCEVTDTVTAYLALACRRPEHPGHDLMLVWSERQGWAVSVETDPADPPVTLARLGGDMVPHPDTVARFVTETIARSGPGRTLVALPATLNRSLLVEHMNRHTRQR